MPQCVPEPEPGVPRKSALIIVDVQNDFITGTLANQFQAEVRHWSIRSLGHWGSRAVGQWGSRAVGQWGSWAVGRGALGQWAVGVR